jgi:hypothetical protein
VREAVRPEEAEMALIASFLAAEGIALTHDAYILFVDAVSERLFAAYPVPLHPGHSCSVEFTTGFFIGAFQTASASARQQVSDGHSRPAGAVKKQRITGLHFGLHGVAANRHPMRRARIATE